MEIKVIKATKSPAADSAADPARKLRVCAYARVSTDSEEQETSYESQCRHYTEYISNNPEWEFAGLYADEGITGTSTKKRDEFNRMIADCEAGKIDLVITKSVSRWARNTLDSLKYIRRLKDLGTAVYFEKEGINTLDTQGEILITIMSSLAQQESDSISQNVKLGIRFLMQQGKGRLNTTFFLGYERDHVSGSLVIVPDEAETVRRIYREYLDGYSPNMIAGHLTKDLVKTPAMKDKWRQSTVVSILQNEKYCGDLLLQKYYVPSFLTHRSVRNTGQLPQYFVEEAHEPIIPREVFYQIQGEMQRRSALMNDQAKLRYGSSTALSGRVTCGHCGRTMKQYKDVNGVIDYRCKVRSYERKAAYRKIISPCGIRAAAETELKLVIVEAFNRLPEMRDDLIRMQGGIRDGEIRRIDQHLEMLQQQMDRIESRIMVVAGEESSWQDTAGHSNTVMKGSSSMENDIDALSGNVGAVEAANNTGSATDNNSGKATSSDAERVERETDAAVAETNHSSESSESSELTFLKDELEQLDAEYTQLTLERADAMNKEIQIRKLLELVDIMCEATVKEVACEAACRDYEDFFRRTRFVPAEGIIADGKLASFSDDLVIRYLKEVVVLDYGYNVVFKAGMVIRI